MFPRLNSDVFVITQQQQQQQQQQQPPPSFVLNEKNLSDERFTGQRKTGANSFVQVVDRW